MLTPKGRGPFAEQVEEVLSLIQTVLRDQPQAMEVTIQTVFLRDAGDRGRCEQLLAVFYGSRSPVTNYVLQPPCGGAALALEVWAIGGKDVKVERLDAQTLAVSYGSVRWVYCAGVESTGSAEGVYGQSMAGLEQMRRCLEQAGTSFEHVVRTWLYLGDIVEPEGLIQRYKELNRARSDFYEHLRFCGSLLDPQIPHGIYPASTGIGTQGKDLVLSCLTLQTSRDDVRLLPLENPQQTPAYAYHPRYSPQSPKFSRGMALLLGGYVTTWISGTASIVNSESLHDGDVEKQAEQTIDNIGRLISGENFAFHGVKGAGAKLSDLAKVRVYIKRIEDYPKCREVCERRFGSVPAIYALAEVCRPELLVEIEGVAFSRYLPPPPA